MKAYMMIGVPGSGKSTYAKNLIKYVNDIDKKQNIVCISRDEIRFSLLKEGDAYFSKENQVYKIFVQKIRENLKAGNDVIIDATHMTWGSRHKMFKNLANIKNLEIIGVWMHIPFSKCYENNNRREGLAKVPEDTLKNMIEHFEKPEIKEGFTEIWEIW
jgi:predicted kinase